MKERPILFSAPMVRAILSGSKSQTRRVVNGAPADWAPMPPQAFYPTIIRGELEEPGDQSFGAGDEDGQNWISCKFGQPGDRLWVRETWQAFERGMDVYDGIPKQRPENCGLLYAADDVDAMNFWRPSIHMPRWASRLTLEITGVRVERLQDISEADARAEGCPHTHLFAHDPREWFTRLWGDINGADSWAANPWVWVVEFRKT